jgi:multiple antibiotic resistance protein
MDIFLGLLRDFGLTFVPLFVAMDAISAVPILLSLTQSMSVRERSRVVRTGLVTALSLGILFILVGKGIFLLLGITVNDFLVAGGLILFLLGAKELVVGKMFEEQAQMDDIGVAVVPLGTPLVVGPAVLATLLILIDQYNIFMVTLSFVINLLIAWVMFGQASRLVRLIGKSGMLALSKIMALFLAAIAVSMIHRGIAAFIK